MVADQHATRVDNRPTASRLATHLEPEFLQTGVHGFGPSWATLHGVSHDEGSLQTALAPDGEMAPLSSAKSSSASSTLRAAPRSHGS
jgi:hypothetical protein